MPLLVFSNGTSEEVDYNTAAKVYQTLQGNDEQYHKDQDWPFIEAYALNTQEVVFKPKASRKPWLTRKLGQQNAKD